MSFTLSIHSVQYKAKRKESMLIDVARLTNINTSLNPIFGGVPKFDNELNLVMKTNSLHHTLHESDKSIKQTVIRSRNHNKTIWHYI